MIDEVILAKKINLVRNYGCPIYSRANLVSLLVLEKQHEDLLLSFLHLVCLLAVEAPVSEALWGQLSHPDNPLTDHHACPQRLLRGTVAVCGCGLRCLCSSWEMVRFPGSKLCH